MKEYEIFLPLYFNDGTPIDTAFIPALRVRLLEEFNGVTFRVQQRLSDGLAFTSFYTLSKAIDDASDPGGTAYEANLPQNVYDMTSEEANASFDHRHRFVASATYALPNIGGSSISPSNLIAPPRRASASIAAARIAHLRDTSDGEGV